MIALFAGTSEGKVILSYLLEKNLDIVLYTATEEGSRIYGSNPSVQVSNKPLDLEGIKASLLKYNIKIVIDSTHPYAQVISNHLNRVTHDLGLDYYRFQRESLVEKNNYDTYTDIIECLNETKGSILLTIGSNHLDIFSQGIDIQRLFIRVLPTQSVIKKCYDLGFMTHQIIAMQGPFNYDMNLALFKQLGVKHLVTKDSGRAGGILEKIEAAKALGVESYVLNRPESVNGYGRLDELFSALDEVLND